MSASSMAALVTSRALIAGGADVDTWEARRAAITAVARGSGRSQQRTCGLDDLSKFRRDHRRNRYRPR